MKETSFSGSFPSQLTTDVIDTPGGQRLALTIRTPTLTIFLRGADAKSWARQLVSEAAMLSDSGLAVANGIH